MKSLICPVSSLRLNENIARVTCFLLAGLMALYAATGAVFFVAVSAIHYFIVGFIDFKFSPFGWLAARIARHFDLPEIKIHKAPLIFSARLGFVFMCATVALFFIHPTGSLIIGLTLMSLALLQSLGNICIGCLAYFHVVLPVFGIKRERLELPTKRRKIMHRLFRISFVILLLLSSTALAQLPRTLNYQGVLSDGSGNAVADGSYTMTYRIYDHASDGSALWSEEQTVTVHAGVFNVVLGSNKPLTVTFDRPLFLGISINGEAELSPRLAFTGTAYSFHALTIADGAVTAATIKDKAVSAAQIDDGQVVKSLNGLKDDVVLAAGENVSIATSGNTLTINAVGGNGGSGISIIEAGTGLTGGGSTSKVSLAIDVPLHLQGKIENATEAVIAGENVDGLGAGVLGSHRSSGNFGKLGSQDFGVWGFQKFFEKEGFLGVQDFGVYGVDRKRGNWGFLGGESSGAQGQHFNGNFGSLGTISYGIYGEHTGNGKDKTWGAIGHGTFGVRGTHDSTNNSGLLGTGFAGVEAFHGQTLNNGHIGGELYGVFGEHEVSENYGILGSASFGIFSEHGGSGNIAIIAGQGYGVLAYSGKAQTQGDLATSQEGVRGHYFGNGSVNRGMLGTSQYGVYANHGSTGNFGYMGGSSYAVRGVYAKQNNRGSLGTSLAGVEGIAGTNSANAGYFRGTVQVIGKLTKSSGSFRIDHPLDPANKYLSHSFVESPDMMNIYNGNVVLDGNGAATVQMPEWFEALNMEFRYQLTAIGAPSPNLHIAEEISGNRFKISGGPAFGRVSWQVTGIRHDAYARANRIPVEEMKTGAEVGRFLNPVEHGAPESMAIGYLPETDKEVSLPSAETERQAINDLRENVKRQRQERKQQLQLEK